MRGCKRFTLMWVCLLLTTVMAQGAYVTFEQVTVANTSIGFTNALIVVGSGHPQATHAQCRLETAEIRYRSDGTAPTTTVGTPLEPGDVIDVYGNANLQAFRSIRTGATSGVLSCHYDDDLKEGRR